MIIFDPDKMDGMVSVKELFEKLEAAAWWDNTDKEIAEGILLGMKPSPDFKAMYIEALKTNPDMDICEKCLNYIECHREKCPSFQQGNEGFIDEKKVSFGWTCMDFNYGECPVLENTPCNGCFQNDFKGFKLKE